MSASKAFRDRCNVIFDGIDTTIFSPGPYESVVDHLDIAIKNKPLLTYATRGLEPYRGFPEFAKAAEDLLLHDPDWHVAIAGADKVNYHKNPRSSNLRYGERAKERFTQLGLENRVHFLGSLPLIKYRNLLRRSNLHCYFTRPYVLSWSLLESSLTGCKLLSSSTEPVKEFLSDDTGAFLVDHTAENLGDKLINYSRQSKIKSIKEDQSRRNARIEMQKFACKSNCVKKHLDLLGLNV